MRGFLQDYTEHRLHKEAGWEKFVTAPFEVGWNLIKGGIGILPTALTIGFAAAAAIGGAGGYIAAKGSSPEIATATAEQDIAHEALETEIDIVKRQVAELERKKKDAKKLAKQKQKKAYDRFV